MTEAARLDNLPRCYTAGELLTMDFPPQEWVVPGLLTTGLTIFAGSPKLGKSWLALALDVAVGSGGVFLGRYRVPRGRAVYLALEDHPRRLKDRLIRIGAQREADVAVFTEWRAGIEGVKDLDAYLAAYPATLVIIDTLARFRGSIGSSENQYAADYAAASSIKRIADKHGVAVLLIHHTRKASSEDYMDMVSGTNGLSGAADSTWVLSRARGEAGARLMATGRDIEEAAIALTFDRELCTWRALGDAHEFAQTEERRLILRALEGGPRKLQDLVGTVGKGSTALSNRLRDLEAEGLVRRVQYGIWALSSWDRESVNLPF